VPLLLDETDVDDLADTALTLAAARLTADIVAGGRLSTSRVQVGDDRIWSRVLIGIIPELDLLGYKEFHRVDKRVRYHVHLFSRETGDHLGSVDGRRITSLRTAATAALAVAHHASAGPLPVGVIGSGEEAREGLRALHTAIAIDSVKVFSPTLANREEYALTMAAELAIPIEPVGAVDDAIDGCHVLYVATSAASDPFLAAKQVPDVAVLAAIGSTRPDQRELHGDVIADAGHVVIDCDDARHEPGDVTDAVDNFGFDAFSAVLLGDDLSAPSTTTGQVVFKSIGSVEQDLVLAHHLLRAAESAGSGTSAAPIASLRIMR
jgi:alanine dehydrogenase